MSRGSLDYTDTFAFDLAGNRVEVNRTGTENGHDNYTTVYTYDVNDRLVTETKDHADDTKDRHAVYTFDGTTQTGKAVHHGLDATSVVREHTTMEYDERGRMQTIVVTQFDESGTQVSQKTTAYGYSHGGLRISEAVDDGETIVQKAYLFDRMNPTGYAQVLEQYINDVLERSYVLGHDVISQHDATNGS